jgi:hypothetical protein
MREISAFSEQDLKAQHQLYRGTGGASVDESNRSMNFLPAFLDSETGKVYPSLNADGSPACMHILSGLPNELVLARDDNGRVCAVKPSLVVGFTRDGVFYTRDEAAALAASSN